MPILKKKNIRHDITQLSNYARISQVSGHDGSDHESPGSPVGVSGSWLGFGVRGARHSSFGTEDWKFKQKFSSNHPKSSIKLLTQLMDSFDEERQMADATRNGSVCDTAIISQFVLDGTNPCVKKH